MGIAMIMVRPTITTRIMVITHNLFEECLKRKSMHMAKSINSKNTNIVRRKHC